MAQENWNTILRQVVIRANQLDGGTAATLRANYIDATIDETNMADKGVQFPFEAVQDAILTAGDRIVRTIANNPKSPYRTYFSDVTASLASGAAIPNVSAGGKSRVGVIGQVRDASNFRLCLRVSPQTVQSRINLNANLKLAAYKYATDNTRIWHTRTNIVCDIVVWDKDEQRTVMNTTPARGLCPFPQDLHETLITGALSILFRENFNLAQVQNWSGYYENSIQEIAMYGQDAKAETKQSGE